MRADVERWFTGNRDWLQPDEQADFRGTLDEVWTLFREGFLKVQRPAGQGELDMAFLASQAEPMPAEAKRYSDDRVRKLVALCNRLDREGNGEFFLSGESAGELVGVSQRWASRFLKMLCVDGVLAVTKPAVKTVRATQYRYVRPNTADPTHSALHPV